MSATTDVAIVGAGPYGLSVAAHLRAAGTRFRQFGLPMNLWRAKMPAGMFLKSQGFASNLSDPAGTHTLEAFCQATGRPYRHYGLPVSLETFVAYGRWFAGEVVPDLEETVVTELAQAGGQFRLGLADGKSVLARRVVIAAGVEHFAYVPEPLLPCRPRCARTAARTRTCRCSRGRQVIVVGAGQSALETAALLHENGASVAGSRQESTPRLERAAARPGTAAAPAAARTRIGPWLGIGELVLLQPPLPLPSPAPVHPCLPRPHRTRPCRGVLAARPRRRPVPGSDRSHPHQSRGRSHRGLPSLSPPRPAHPSS